MDLIFWWMLLVWLGVFAGYWIIRYLLSLRKKQKSSAHSAVPIAHSDRLINMPSYKSAMKKYRLLLNITIACLTLSVASGVLLSARPAQVSLIEPIQQSRDIMLCLDVSGSMLRVDTTIINRFTSLVKSFDGQRIGLGVFNSSSIAVIPLSDDYTFITQQLTKAGNALKTQNGQDFTDLTSGTLAGFEKGTSLVGDGLVSCMNNLGANPQQRSQSIVLATDNEINGTPIITLKQASSLAQEKNIRLYAIDPVSDGGVRAADHATYKTLIESTGGSYFRLSNASTVSSIVNDISTQEAKFTSTAPTVAIVDHPTPFIAIAVIATVLSLALVWRLKL